MVQNEKWSEWRDSNPRPSGPKPDALPGCATLRRAGFIAYAANWQADKTHKMQKMRIFLSIRLQPCRQQQTRRRFDPVSGHTAAIQFKHIAGWRGGSTRLQCLWRDIFDSVNKLPLVIKKQHIKRDKGILHPEAAHRICFEHKQHSFVITKCRNEHQAILVLHWCDRHLNSHIDFATVARINQDLRSIKDGPVSIGSGDKTAERHNGRQNSSNQQFVSSPRQDSQSPEALPVIRFAP